MIHEYFEPVDFLRNNLSNSSNPYLRQHMGNPVWWQEWNPQTLEYAREHDKPLFVSVGYSTCHWCHVMAQEAFSDAECADLLNRQFVSIKIDREQRPDIDQYLMSFLVATTGSGGWPLNAFLTPDGNPFYAMTYASTEARFQTPAFSDILEQLRRFYDKRKGEIQPFEVPPRASEPAARNENGTGIRAARDPESPTAIAAEPVLAIITPSDDDEIADKVRDLKRAFDRGFGGFGSSQKFPPHSTLLFMLHASAGDGDGDGTVMARSCSPWPLKRWTL